VTESATLGAGATKSPTPTRSAPSAVATTPRQATSYPVYTPPAYTPPGNGYTYIDTPPGNTSTRYPHGSITRAQILVRAQAWLHEQVPYSQTSWWRDGDGIYRQDCSGYVSMAWALDEQIDFWTGNLNTVSHVVDPAALAPGDILLSTSHTVIFAGWADTAHSVFDFYEESHPGTNARFVVDAPLARFLNAGYTPFRYDGVLEAGTLPANPATGLDFAALQAGSDELAPNGNDTASPPPASWQAGYVPSASASPSPSAKARRTEAAADARPIEPPLGFVLASSGVVFLVGGAVIARGVPRLASTAKRPRRRH
jgi:hypothetical protein